MEKSIEFVVVAIGVPEPPKQYDVSWFRKNNVEALGICRLAPTILIVHVSEVHDKPAFGELLISLRRKYIELLEAKKVSLVAV